MRVLLYIFINIKQQHTGLEKSSFFAKLLFNSNYLFKTTFLVDIFRSIYHGHNTEAVSDLLLGELPTLCFVPNSIHQEAGLNDI